MTDKAFNDYYLSNKDRYMSLAKTCTSVPELLLKLEIYGKKWTQWDWVILFSCVIDQMFQSMFASLETGNKVLYDDIIDAIDCSELLDTVITNKQVLLSIIHVVNGNFKFHTMTFELKMQLYNLLAHIFKKFPSLWTMSWMWAKFKDPSTKKWQKYHRLKSSVQNASFKTSFDPYYKSKQYFDDFIKQHLNASNGQQ